MKHLHGAASADVDMPIERCFAVLAAIELYPSWYPEVVRAMDVLETDAGGAATRVQTTLHLSHGPLVKDFTLQLAVRLQSPALVELPASLTGRATAKSSRWPGGSRTAAILTSSSRSTPRWRCLGSFPSAQSATPSPRAS